MIQKFPLVFILTVLFNYSCKEPKKPYFISENANRLLAGDSVKIWKLSKRFNNGYRMNMGDCFLSYRVFYYLNQSMNDNNGTHRDCGPTFEATWSFSKTEKGSYLKLQSDVVPEFFGGEKDYKFFKILQLSEEELVLQFKHNQYSENSTIMVDHLVPEYVSVENRDFHH